MEISGGYTMEDLEKIRVFHSELFSVDLSGRLDTDSRDPYKLYWIMWDR